MFNNKLFAFVVVTGGSGTILLHYITESRPKIDLIDAVCL